MATDEQRNILEKEIRVALKENNPVCPTGALISSEEEQFLFEMLIEDRCKHLHTFADLEATKESLNDYEQLEGALCPEGMTFQTYFDQLEAENQDLKLKLAAKELATSITGVTETAKHTAVSVAGAAEAMAHMRDMAEKLQAAGVLETAHHTIFSYEPNLQLDGTIRQRVKVKRN